MREFKKALSLLLAIVMLLSLCLTALVACDGSDEPTESKPGTETESESESTLKPSVSESASNTESETTSGNTESDSETESTPPPAGSTTYTVSLKSVGGMAIKDAMFFVYEDETLTSIVNYIVTDASGEASITLPTLDTYVVAFLQAPEGYTTEAYYTFDDNGHAEITLYSGIITDGVPSGTYELGDIMYDMTVKDYRSEESVKLSDILKEKDMILINYWYDGCQYCLEEFPALNEVYNAYKDSVEVVALSHKDTDSNIESFMTKWESVLPEGGLDFIVGYYPEILNLFMFEGAPTSIIVDRYGVICCIISGAMKAREFDAIFDYFTGDDYVQQIIEDPSILMPIAKPDIQMQPSADIEAAINSGNINITYHPETDEDAAEYAWPFITAVKNGVNCIKSSNAYNFLTYSIIYADVEMKAGDVLAFDYWASTEYGKDVLGVFIDGKDMFQISGDSDKWETCYAYVAPSDGIYEICLAYVKDDDIDIGEDSVYISNMRITTVDEIDVDTYIFRYAATDYSELGGGYDTYVDVVLGEDGYYHVGAADGPILLANLLNTTRFDNLGSVWGYVYNGLIEDETVVAKLTDYCNYASNSKLIGYCSVTEELRGLLEHVVDTIGSEFDNPDQWLQLCCYYDAYGKDTPQLEDPVKGLAAFSAYEAELNVENSVTYTQIIMPRGLFYKFTPEVSGAYRVSSNSDQLVEGWIFNENREILYTYEHNEKLWMDMKNVSMIMYMEAGVDYYINIAYWDPYMVGTFTFTVSFIGETADIFTLASPTYFEFEDDGDGVIDPDAISIAGGVDVMLVDGKYYVKNEDGTQGPVLYADFWTTGLFEQSIDQMIDMGGFNFAKSALDEDIEFHLGLIDAYMTENEITDRAQAEAKYFQELWGIEKYNQRIDYIADVKAGIYHGVGDFTDLMREYESKLILNSDKVELNGCVEMTEELAEALQALVDAYSLHAEHSWTKLCFYYKHYGPAN